ncbi:MAG TPA: hypothetical protein VFV38_53115 [Ktedonobacteraceae bacterium]|nr:hypothetical protein [Ktedonobacteraceae bacterium]
MQKTWHTGMKTLVRALGAVAVLAAALSLTRVPSATAASHHALNPHSGGGRSCITVHTATAANTFGNYTFIDDFFSEDDSSFSYFVTQRLTADAYNPHNVGVFYNTSLRHWAIYNEDDAPMPIGAAFNVYLASVCNTSDIAFFHEAANFNSSANYTVINNPLVNGNPNLELFVTHNYNRGGFGGILDDHPLGVWYTPDGHWSIFHEDGTALPWGADYNILVKARGGFIHQTTADNSAWTWTWMDTGLLNNLPGAAILVTPIWNPYGLGSGVYVTSPLEVMYDDSRNQWAIFTPDWAVAPGADFNVYRL